MAEESEQSPYYLAARFNSEPAAERTYFRLQHYIGRESSQLDLSVFRFLLRGASIVAVVGDDPGTAEGRRLERALSSGERISLDADALGFLMQRRDQATQQGPWVERHFRPGQGFRFDR